MTQLLRFARRGTFWSASAVLALCLWASGAPSVLYPVYAAEWHLPPVVVTSVFGAYPLALLVVLLLFGGISDTIGRRRAMLLGVAFIVLAAAVFAVAPNVGWLFVARILQGMGTGFALGAASAALVENNGSKNPRFASTVTTVATAAGLTLALVVAGFLAQYLPLPLVLSFVVLFVLGALSFVAVWVTPDDRRVLTPDPRRVGAPAAATPTGDSARNEAAPAGNAAAAPAHAPARWRPQALHLPPGILRVFIASTLSVGVAYSVGAIFLSLGAQMARQLTGTTDLLVVGLLLGLSSLMIGLTALFLQRIHAHLAIVLGGAISLLGLVFMAVTAASGSLAFFFAWCVAGGVGYSFAFVGGLSLVNRTAPAQHRGATLSMLYLFAYLLQAVAAIGAGALATALGLGPAVDIAAPALGVLCALAIVFASVDFVAQRRRARVIALSTEVLESAA
jgi:MFS family permease